MPASCGPPAYKYLEPLQAQVFWTKLLAGLQASALVRGWEPFRLSGADRCPADTPAALCHVGFVAGEPLAHPPRRSLPHASMIAARALHSHSVAAISVSNLSFAFSARSRLLAGTPKPVSRSLALQQRAMALAAGGGAPAGGCVAVRGWRAWARDDVSLGIPTRAINLPLKPLAHLFCLRFISEPKLAAARVHTHLWNALGQHHWQAGGRAIAPHARHPPQPSLLCRVRTALDEMSNGEFKRKESQFRNHIKRGGEYEPEGTWHRAWGRTSRPSAPLAVPVEALLQPWTA